MRSMEDGRHRSSRPALHTRFGAYHRRHRRDRLRLKDTSGFDHQVTKNPRIQGLEGSIIMSQIPVTPSGMSQWSSNRKRQHQRWKGRPRQQDLGDTCLYYKGRTSPTRGRKSGKKVNRRNHRKRGSRQGQWKMLWDRVMSDNQRGITWEKIVLVLAVTQNDCTCSEGA